MHSRPQHRYPFSRLIGSLERRYGLALVLVQGFSNDLSEREVDLAVFSIGHDGKCVLHPLGVTVDKKKCEYASSRRKAWRLRTLGRGNLLGRGHLETLVGWRQKRRFAWRSGASFGVPKSRRDRY